MVKIAIVDDEERSRQELKNYLEKFGNENGKEFSIVFFSNGVEFISDYTAAYDLVFMDIDMPHMNGLETAKMMRKLDSKVALIFITALAKYAIKGYEVNAINFIVKPLNYAVFSAKMKNVLRYIQIDEEPFVTINTRLGLSKIYLLDIYYITVAGRYVTLHTKTGAVELKKSMKELEKELEKYDFVRCDNSAMVNLRYVTAVNVEGVVVNNEIVPYSRNRKKTLLDAFTLYLR